VESQWRALGTSGGISYLQEKIASTRPKTDWKMARFDAVSGDTEFIPLPESVA